MLKYFAKFEVTFAEYLILVSALDKAWTAASLLLQATLGGNALSGVIPQGNMTHVNVTASYASDS